MPEWLFKDPGVDTRVVKSASRLARRVRALAVALTVACSIPALLLWIGIAAALHAAPAR